MLVLQPEAHIEQMADQYGSHENRTRIAAPDKRSVESVPEIRKAGDGCCDGVTLRETMKTPRSDTRIRKRLQRSKES